MALKTWLLVVVTHFTFVCAQNGAETSKFQSSHCTLSGTSTSVSYMNDVATLLGSLSSNMGNSGFYNASVGGAYAIALCRVDIELDTCRSCVNDVSEEILLRCQRGRQAIMWEDLCMVRWSNQPIVGQVANEPHANISNQLAVPAQDPVIKVRTQLIDDLRAQAADGGALRKAAADSREVTDGETARIYAMVQCTPDLSPEDCLSCSATAVQQISQCCNEKSSVILCKPSCTIRFGTSPFYNFTRVQELLQLPPTPPPTPILAPHPTPPHQVIPTNQTLSGNDNGSNTTTRNSIIIVVSILAFLLAASCVGLFARKRMKQKKKQEPAGVQMERPLLVVKDGDQVSKDGDQVGKNGEHISSDESIKYDIGTIIAATNNFSESNKLGEGGFGTVYKGELQDGQKIAVKRLAKDSFQGDVEFKNEVSYLTELQHKNLVRLLGFSSEGSEKLLVYEFVQNKSLDNFIFDPIKSSNLDWTTRYKIIEGIAKGLLYLHEDSGIKIIHRDLKASNILLDENMDPKISDFGIAKLVSREATQAVTKRIIGTEGYMAPEYEKDGNFSKKSDVYSFGILVLEIITGKRSKNSENLASHAWRSWREQMSKIMIDPALVDKSDDDQTKMERCIQISLSCIQQDPKQRPSIGVVVQCLNSGLSITLPKPSDKPGFYVPSTFTKDHPEDK